MALKKGDAVRYVIPDIVGTIVAARVNDDAEFLYEVEYTDANGDVQTRTFKVDELVLDTQSV
jgi:hypothetical protein